MSISVLSYKPAPSIFLSSTRAIHPRWKDENNMPQNPNSYGPLTDLPDYTFLDGKPTPLIVGQQERMVVQQQLAEDVIRLTAEVDFAVQHHIQQEQLRKENIKSIIDGKLKAKGKHLIKKVKSLA